MATFAVRLKTPAHDMAREEILKQAAFLSSHISDLRFSPDHSEIQFSAPDASGPNLVKEVETLAAKVQRALRSLERKIVVQSSAAAADPHFTDLPDLTGARFTGEGQALLQGLPLRIFRYFDRVFEAYGMRWNAEPLNIPTLIPSRVLARCDYFRSFPQYVTFATHIKPEVEVIDSFCSRHQHAEDVDGQALADMHHPDTCLTPALCYHVYHMYENQTIPAGGTVHGVFGKCFRYESTNMMDLRRLWDFSMREVVFIGGRTEVLTARDQSIESMAAILEDHRIAAEIRTASDPFFVAPDATAKTYFQLTSEAKFEVAAYLAHGERLAISSHNYHSDFFGRVFAVNVANDGGPMHSVCIGFGLERWVYAFLQQHGTDPSRWPDAMRNAPEFTAFRR